MTVLEVGDIYILVPSHQKETLQRNYTENIIVLRGVKIRAPLFVPFKTYKNETTLQDINLFYIHMALDTIGGKVTDASQLKSRILLLEIHSD
jgi:hypothetical protein